MTVRRLAAAAALAALCVGTSLGQSELEDAEQPVSNWSAPPYWIPTDGGGKNVEEVLAETGEPQVEPMGTLPSSPLPLTAVTPCRIVDTRNAPGAFGGPALVANATRTFALPTGPCAGIPVDAAAYSLNFTIIGGSGVFTNAFLTAWATGDTQPVVSTLNFNANQLESNAAVVPAGTSGSINIFVNAPANVLIDINGYYKAIPIVNTLNALSGNVTLAQGTNITITPSGQTLTIANTAPAPPAAWHLTGNAGTTPGTNFLGTTDNQALEIKVNGSRALRIEPGTTPNVVGGYFGNLATAGVNGATIGGGGGISVFVNRVTDDYGTVGGGLGNRAGDNAGTTADALYATVGGGQGNVATAANATVAGGVTNTASAVYSFVGGGFSNTATADRGVIGGGEGNIVEAGSYVTIGGGQSNIAETQWSTVAGGFGNSALGIAATIPGGRSNLVSADYGFAAGRRAHATTAGSFIWGDSTDADINTTGANQFIVRASGGIWLGTTSTPSLTIATDFINTSTGAHLTIGGAWTNSSDFERKENFEEVDPREVLTRLASLPITRWSYKAEDHAVRHLGPTGQDFAAAFGLGSDNRSIVTVDADGVALASIQALYEMVKEKQSEIDALRSELATVKRIVLSQDCRE